MRTRTSKLLNIIWTFSRSAVATLSGSISSVISSSLRDGGSYLKKQTKPSPYQRRNVRIMRNGDVDNHDILVQHGKKLVSVGYPLPSTVNIHPLLRFDFGLLHIRCVDQVVEQLARFVGHLKINVLDVIWVESGEGLLPQSWWSGGRRGGN